VWRAWYFTCKVKAEGYSITEIRAHEARAENKPDFNNAPTHGFYEA
jgi:hypothetical protein